MAVSWPPKAPTEVSEYPWVPKPDAGVDSATPVVTTGTATIVAEIAGDTVTLRITGGAAGVVQVFTVTAIVGYETLVETFYLPVETSVNRLAYTARDVCLFALRKIVGNGEEPTADELADALERLNDMVAMWRETGADMGLPLPLLGASSLYISDSEYSALKLNLRNACHEFYGEALSQQNVIEARQAKAVVMNARIVHRAAEFY